MNGYFTLDYWKNFFNSPTKKRLAENFTSLSVLQALNYLLPLITLPYLVRVLGPEKYGLISFAQAFIGYFIILTDYGFRLSATREISIHRENKEKISEIFSSMMMVRFILGIVSFIILVLLLFFVPKFGKDWLIYIFTFGMVLGNILFPACFFQGMERMKYITILNLISRIIFTVFIFIFIRKASDYLYVPLINSLGFLIAGILSLWVISKNFKIKFVLPTIKSIKHQLKEGWHIFISTIAVAAYNNTRVFTVGLFTNNTITGYYSIAEKLINVISFPLNSLLQVLYPRLNKIFTENKVKAIKLLNRFQNLTNLAYIFVLPFFFIFAPYIIKFISGLSNHEIIWSFKLLLVALFFTIANTFKVHLLLIYGKSDIFAKIHVFMGMIGLILTFLLTYFFSYVGSAIAFILVSLSVLILTIKYYADGKINA
jgi:PST family polysaccharide transporter